MQQSKRTNNFQESQKNNTNSKSRQDPRAQKDWKKNPTGSFKENCPAGSVQKNTGYKLQKTPGINPPQKFRASSPFLQTRPRLLVWSPHCFRRPTGTRTGALDVAGSGKNVLLSLSCCIRVVLLEPKVREL